MPSPYSRQCSQSLLHIAKPSSDLKLMYFAALFTKWPFSGDTQRSSLLDLYRLHHWITGGEQPYPGLFSKLVAEKGQGWKPQSRVALLSNKEHSTQLYTRPWESINQSINEDVFSAFVFFGKWREKESELSLNILLSSLVKYLFSSSQFCLYLPKWCWIWYSTTFPSILKPKFPLGITLFLFVPPQIADELFNICQACLFISLTIETYDIHQCPGDISGS